MRTVTINTPNSLPWNIYREFYNKIKAINPDRAVANIYAPIAFNFRKFNIRKFNII